jgi:hypothetical protein
MEHSIEVEELTVASRFRTAARPDSLERWRLLG